MTRENNRQDSKAISDDEMVRIATGQTLSTDFSHLKRDGYQQRLVNDEKGEVEKMRRIGWQPVEGSSTAGSFLESQENNRQNAKKPSANNKSGVSYISVHVGQISTRSDGRAILMEIDDERYNKIQAGKSKQLDKTDQALRGGGDQSSTGLPSSSPTGGSETESNSNLSTYQPNLPNGQTGFSEKSAETLG